MKRAVIIVSISRSQNEILLEKYRQKVPKYFEAFCHEGRQLCLPLEEGSAELNDALQFISEQGMDTGLFSRVYYTKKEIAQTRYFHFLEQCPLELEGTSAAEYGTKYEGRCFSCDSGGIRIGDVLIDRKFVRNVRFGNLLPELIVSKELKELIEEAELTGITFGPMVKDFKNREIPPFYVAQIDNVLPALSESTWLIPGGSCSHCKQETIYLQSDFQYEEEKLANAKDFNLTCEYLDNWHLRSIVVSAKVRNLFNENKIRVCRFTPVTIP